MLQPKTGMLALTLRSYLRSSRLPILFVPVYIGYERVLEGRTYLGELRGAAKKKESIFDIFRVIGALKQRFGQVWVNFGEPLKLNEFLEQSNRLAPAGICAGLSPAVAERRHQPPPSASPSASTRRRPSTRSTRWRWRCLHQPSGAGPAIPGTHPRSLPGAAARSALFATHHAAGGDGNALIAYVKSLDLLAEQKDALGNILYLDEQNAVLMTYYRNNVMHIFALPALLASFFQSSSRISREQIQRFTEALYPICVPSCSCAGEVEELEAVVDQWLAAFVEHGLLKVDGNHYVRPAPSSRQFVLLTLLARVVMQTLQRFYMATSLLLRQRPAQPERRGAGESLHGHGPTPVDTHGLNALSSSTRRCSATSFRACRNRVWSARMPTAAWATTKARGAGRGCRQARAAEIRLSIRQVALERHHDDSEATPPPDA